MTDFKAARINMVDSQIHTMGVVSEPVLEAFRTVSREDFVPAERRTIAYCDEDLAVSAGRFLMEPVTHARLMQAALPVKTDTVLDIGGSTGYSAAIFSGLAAKVVAVEPDTQLLAKAEETWLQLGLSSILPHNGPFAAGYEAAAPYTLIFINGSMAEIPSTLVDQLAPGGRLVGVVKGANDKIGRAVIITKSESGSIGERVLFDAAVPYLPGHQPRVGFVF
jgi:protein-L-isoaspartate(D-aspartate) O-methyltransferase